jgi:hypothetical protein
MLFRTAAGLDATQELSQFLLKLESLDLLDLGPLEPNWFIAGPPLAQSNPTPALTSSTAINLGHSQSTTAVDTQGSEAPTAGGLSRINTTTDPPPPSSQLEERNPPSEASRPLGSDEILDEEPRHSDDPNEEHDNGDSSGDDSHHSNNDTAESAATDSTSPMVDDESDDNYPGKGDKKNGEGEKGKGQGKGKGRGKGKRKGKGKGKGKDGKGKRNSLPLDRLRPDIPLHVPEMKKSSQPRKHTPDITIVRPAKLSENRLKVALHRVQSNDEPDEYEFRAPESTVRRRIS